MSATEPAHRGGRGWPALAAALVVAVAQLWLVAAIGTDVPFQDQWDVEGRALYPAYLDGTLAPRDLVAPHNEHRIAWTRLADLALFSANGGQWDPLVQLVLNALLHGVVAALVVWGGTRDRSPPARWTSAGIVTLALLPIAAWHNAVWGFQSQVYFSLGWGLLAIALWTEATGPGGRLLAWLAVMAAMISMAPGALVPAGMLVAVVLTMRERPPRVSEVAVLGVLLGLGILLTRNAGDTQGLHASPGQWLVAWGRLLAWPHVDQPLAALVVNLPLGWLVISRLRGRRAMRGENFVLAAAAWIAAVTAAMAWGRGGSAEFAAGVPSRYVDFVVLLPLANAWALGLLLRMVVSSQRQRLRLAVAAWSAFVGIGWVGLSVQMARGVILPRARDPEAPVRLMREYQITGNASVFAGQPRLLVPHPNPSSVRGVLDDPRLEDHLPPSLQPDRRPGPLSRFTRTLLRR